MLVADVAIEPDAADLYNRAYLNTIGADQATMCNSIIHVDGREVPFKMDTGAEVTVISDELWTSLHFLTSSSLPPSDCKDLTVSH